MNFALTSFDKAIVAAVIGPLIVFATSYLNGAAFTPQELAGAVLAAVVAGLGVYLKGNAAPAVVPPKA